MDLECRIYYKTATEYVPKGYKETAKLDTTCLNVVLSSNYIIEIPYVKMDYFTPPTMNNWQ